MGTACAWKVHRLFLPTNRSDADLIELRKDVLRVKRHRLLLTSIGIPTSIPTKAYGESEAGVHYGLDHWITPRLRHVDIPICYLHREHRNGLCEANQYLYRINFANVGTKPESSPHLMRSSSIAMCRVHVRQLPQEQYDILTLHASLSCYNHFRSE